MFGSNSDLQVMKRITKILEKFKDNSTIKKEYLRKFSYNTSNFYDLPKTHISNFLRTAVCTYH